jgi:hypothetical protein
MIHTLEILILVAFMAALVVSLGVALWLMVKGRGK